MSKLLFIAATDTEVGKTYVSRGLLETAKLRKLKTIGIKPIASGCWLEHGKLHNEDALILQKSASVHLDYAIVNPFAFMPAIAPHIAAQQTTQTLSVTRLQECIRHTLYMPVDLIVMEGFGGWHAPLNENETMADYASTLNCDVILVVGIKLGCINHAILTVKAIQASGARCAGWIANKIDPKMPFQQENIESLKNWLTAPLLATIEFNQSPQEALTKIKIF